MSLRRSDWVGLATAAGLTAVFVLAFVVPGQKRLAALREQVRIERVRAAEEQLGTTGVANAYRDVDRLTAELKTFEAKIPAQHDFAGTFRDLSKLMTDAGLTKGGIEPGRVGPLPAERRPRDLFLSRRVMVQPVIVRATGTSAALVKWFSALERWERLTRVDSIRITSSLTVDPQPTTKPADTAVAAAAGSKGPAPNESRITCEVELSTYYVPQDAVPASGERVAMSAGESGSASAGSSGSVPH